MANSLFISGAAGLVGQNLIPSLKASGNWRIIAVDKHETNLRWLQRLHPEVETLLADMAEPGEWQQAAGKCDAAILLHAQIGGINPEEFERNNMEATKLCLEALGRGRCQHLVHISSSVVNSAADDLYTRSKTRQEKLVEACGIPHLILRPTLMFGWFDRKHLGWLQRFMQRSPVFPIPGHGRYLRQPLYAGDFSAIIESGLRRQLEGCYNISGLERIDYIDLIRRIRDVTSARAQIMKIPYSAFWSMLKLYSLFDRNPPFTTSQLKALATPDLFEVIDWPGIFEIKPTPLDRALSETFLHPEYSKIQLEF